MDKLIVGGLALFGIYMLNKRRAVAPFIALPPLSNYTIPGTATPPSYLPPNGLTTASVPAYVPYHGGYMSPLANGAVDAQKSYDAPGQNLSADVPVGQTAAFSFVTGSVGAQYMITLADNAGGVITKTIALSDKPDDFSGPITNTGFIPRIFAQLEPNTRYYVNVKYDDDQPGASYTLIMAFYPTGK